MEQRSTDWLEWRKLGIGSSDAPVIMGVSPYTSRWERYHDKRGTLEAQPEYKPKNNDFILELGNKIEPIAREKYFFLSGGVDMQPDCRVYPHWKVLRASYDGVHWPSRKGIEIKLTGEKDWELVRSGVIPEKYFPQVQHQILVGGLDSMDYVAYHLPKECWQDYNLIHRGEIKIINVQPDAEYLDRYVREAWKFWGEVKLGLEPERPVKKTRAKK